MTFLEAIRIGAMAGTTLLFAMIPVAFIGIGIHYLEIWFPI